MKAINVISFASTMYLVFFVSPWFIFATLFVILLDILQGVEEVAKCEKEYIWNMNNGPSTMQRVRFFKNKETNETDIYLWHGDKEGHYKCNDKKYDKELKEIK